MGSTSETSYYGATKNPWDQNRVPGGSSGGSAAAVAGEEAFYSLGTDTGGSIRQPASYCGITGIKPTYGTVSRYGLIAYASSLDQIGTFGRNVSDCTASLEIISGHDPMDGSSANKKSYSYTEALIDDVKGMRIGIPKDFLGEGLEDDIRKSTLEAVEIFRSRGALVEEFDLPYMEYGIATYYAISCAEASSNLSRFDGVRYGYRANEYDDLQELYMKSRGEGFGMEVKRRLMIGGLVLTSDYYEEYYHKAIKMRRLIQESYMKAFESYDVIIGPATPKTAPVLNDTSSDPQKRKLSSMYSVTVNLAGLPAISLPCGIDKSGLPIGLQLIGDHFKENNIIRAAYTFEGEIGGIRNDKV
ncbi:MAG: Asp-tRNA(Asn)/Glu-tRNA(Gln) amidotransferase subunit GatA, partial [Clostridiales bacterium]|nr:Asp-tRNA(Asn)/Glu-tRNA(Gln) amidotransferase subunit GatA [Clostridiales bacterium]